MGRKILDAANWKGLAVYAMPVLLFVAVYLAGAELGHLMSYCDYFPTFWPPVGILLAALTLTPQRQWPFILALSFVTQLASDIGWHGGSSGLSQLNWWIATAEAVAGACILQRLNPGQFSCQTLREVLSISFFGTLLTSATGSLVGERLGGRWLPGSETLGWEVWFSSHMLGGIVFGPMVLTLVAKYRARHQIHFSGWAVIEALAAFIALLAFAHFVYGESIQPYAFLVFPVLVWIALRFETWGTCLGNLMRVCICIWSTRQGHGPFAGDYPDLEQAVMLNSFLSITCATALLTAAVVSERRRAARALQQSELQYRDLLENIGELVHSVNAQGTILYTNRAWRDTLGYDLQETQSLSIFRIVHPDDLARYRTKLARVLTGQIVDRYEFRFITKDGRTLVVEGTCNCRIIDGQPNATRSIYRDITSRREHDAQLDKYRRQLEAANSQLQRLAATDALTGLSNRRAFHERLNEERERSDRLTHSVSLLMIDVDHFKQINDLFGHPAGDKVLQNVAQVIAENAREYDFPARFGGEEFAVILPETDEANAALIAERLRLRIAAIPFPGRLITASIGVATLAANVLPTDEIHDAESLVKCADVALYYSKQTGRNRITPASHIAARTSRSTFEERTSASPALELANS